MLKKYIEQTVAKEYKVYDSVEEPENRRVTTPYIDDQYLVKGSGTTKNRYYTKLGRYYNLEDEYDDTLLFESRFEGGNLHQAYRVGEYEYNLYMQSDTGFAKSKQWFYFRITNITKGAKYRFNINNFQNADSQYRQGMRPLFYSTAWSKTSKLGWYRDGFNIQYFQNHLPKPEGATGFQSTLTFEVIFNHDTDKVFIANSYPYVYTDLINYLEKQVCTKENEDLVRKSVLCKSQAGNDCYQLTITNFKSKEEDIAKREAIVFTGRAHPGESVASYVMEGAINFLLQKKSRRAQFLRDNFVFKIVPMLNADGVINGNQRSCLNGLDFNRQWQYPSAQAPEIAATK